MKIQKLIDSLAFTELPLLKSCSMTLLRNPKCHFFFEIHILGMSFFSSFFHNSRVLIMGT